MDKNYCAYICAGCGIGDALDLELGGDGGEGGFELLDGTMDFDLVGGVVDEGVSELGGGALADDFAVVDDDDLVAAHLDLG